MAYSGYHLKFGNTILPYKYIKLATYKSSPNQRLDLDSYRDSDGVLHREVLSHTASKIEWETPYLTNIDVAEMNAIFNAAMSNQTERKVSVTYYNEENDTYKTGTFYMPDVQYTVYHADLDNKRLIYSPIRIALIEY